MSFRFLLTAAIAGLVSAAAFVPWSMGVREQAILGSQAEPWLLGLGYAFACMAWVTAGGMVTHRPVVRPYLAGPFAGFIAAAVSAWLVWLPAVNVWALNDLWIAFAEAGGGAPDASVVGITTSRLLHASVLGFWGHTAIGALCGLVGTVFTHRLRKGPPVPLRIPALWPLRLWVWSAALVIGGVVALQQTEFEIVWAQAIGQGPMEPLELLLLNGAILGLLVSAPVGAVGVRYIRSDLPTLRRVGLILYITLFVASLLMWVGVVPLLARQAASPSSPWFVAYCLAPVLGLLGGGVFGWRDPAPPIPRVSDMFAEMALLFLVTGPLVTGAGLGAAAWSSVVGPLVWGNVIDGVSQWSNIESTVAEVLGMQALAWGPILAVVLLEGPLMIMPALVMMRRSAMRQAAVRNARMIDAEPTVDVEYDATIPRMALGMPPLEPTIDPAARTVSRATDPVSEVDLHADADAETAVRAGADTDVILPTEAMDGMPGEPEEVNTERIGRVGSKTRVTSPDG